jgi:hypothetical protein
VYAGSLTFFSTNNYYAGSVLGNGAAWLAFVTHRPNPSITAPTSASSRTRYGIVMRSQSFRVIAKPIFLQMWQFHSPINLLLNCREILSRKVDTCSTFSITHPSANSNRHAILKDNHLPIAQRFVK